MPSPRSGRSRCFFVSLSFSYLDFVTAGIVSTMKFGGRPLMKFPVDPALM